MKFTTSTRRLLAWVAMVAMLMAALAPAVSRTLAASADARTAWAEICSVADTGHATAHSTASGKAAPAHSGTLHLDHCGYCSLDGHAPGMLAAAAAPASHDAGVALQPPLFLHAADVLHVWAAAHPRAPPVSLS